MAKLMSLHSPKPVYFYEFAYIGTHSHYEDPVSKRPMGAAHHDDLIYLFTLRYRFPDEPLHSADDAVVQRMTALVYNFARYGYPNPRGDTPELGALHWPAMRPGTRQYLSIGQDFAVRADLFQDRFRVRGGGKSFKLDIRLEEPDVEGAPSGSAASAWRAACGALGARGADDAWAQVAAAAPRDAAWHSLGNCVAYQTRVWRALVARGAADAAQPAAFLLALVLRHARAARAAELLAELLRAHPHAEDLISYILSLLTEDEASYSGASDPSATTPPGPAPPRDLLLFGDCELAILAATKQEYEAHAELVRAEYSKLSQKNYVELRIKVLNQLAQIPKLYHTPEFACFESAARENIQREISTLRGRQHLDRDE